MDKGRTTAGFQNLALSVMQDSICQIVKPQWKVSCEAENIICITGFLIHTFQ